MKPLAGDFAFILFAAGLVQRVALRGVDSAALDRLCRLRGLGLESGVDKRFKEAPFFYWLYTLLIVGGGRR
jgi:hypothetical protein